MARRKSEDVEIELECAGECEEEERPCWLVSGRYNADGLFEAHDLAELDCPECGERGEPTDDSVLADL